VQNKVNGSGVWPRYPLIEMHLQKCGKLQNGNIGNGIFTLKVKEMFEFLEQV
jgi:hypothetical protein